MTTNDRDLDLVTDDPHPGVEAAGWAVVGLVGLGASIGLAATAGWLLRAGWAILRDPPARHLVGIPW